MATHRLEIHHSLLPDTSGFVYWASGNAGGAFDRYPHEMLIFADDSSDRSASGAFQVPQNFNASGTTKILIRWAATVTTGSVVWDLAYKTVSASESLDPTTDDDASDTVTTATNPSTARTTNESSMTITSADFAAGDTVLIKLTRNMANASDDLNSTAYVESVAFEYTD